jgi:hypothetical protein
MAEPGSRVESVIVRRVLAFALLLAAVPRAGADEVAAYLEALGLERLLAVHLEDRLRGLTGDDREELVQRLVGIYARLLESTRDPAVLRDVEERSRRLLAGAPPSVGEDLRFALLRGSYRGAEQAAEDHRLRRGSAEVVARAGETLTDVIPKLNTLRRQVEARLQATERRLSRASGPEASALSAQAEEIQRLLAQITFVSAWALYYQSWLNERPENARPAEELFARLLGAAPRAQPEEISVDLRGVEAMARAILGMALCKSLSGSSAIALQWVELLAHPSAYEPLRLQVPAWKLVIHLEHGEFSAARVLLAANDQAPAAWYRLAAVHALEAQDRSVQAAELARFAVTALAARGDLAAVLDLAGRYGTEALGDRGFAFRYVRGVRAYESARQSLGGAEPATDPDVLRRFDAAAEDFAAAAREPDAAQYSAASASCAWLTGWCRWYQGRDLEARASFEEASGRLGPQQAAESLWMAIVCLDRARGGGGPLGDDMAGLIDRFLERYPASPRSPRLRLLRAAAREPSPEVVDDLLAIGADSDVYDAARQQAAAVLYQLSRAASGEERLALANQFVMVALPLVTGSGPARGEAWLVQCRRILEVALAPGVARLTAASRVLEDLDDAAETGALDLSAVRDEVDCRRVQERLLAEDPAAAEAAADALWARRPDGAWTRLAEITLLRYGVERQAASEAPNDLVLRHGRRVISSHADRPDALRDREVFGQHVVVAQAMLESWRRSGDAATAAEALSIHLRLLEVAPNDARFLHAAGTLAAQLGRNEEALACWRLLASGSEPGSDRWYEARYQQLSVLATIDPARARQAMDQHRLLHPDYGPPPWRERFRALDERLGAPPQDGAQ